MTLENLISEIETVHTRTQKEAIKAVSRNFSLRNWVIGFYIVEYEQNGADRAKYGEKLISDLAQKLSGIKGLSASNLRLFRQFYRSYPQIYQSVTDIFKLPAPMSDLSTDTTLAVPVEKLLNSCTFTHFVELIKLDDALKRTFYEVETIKRNWSVRELKREINTQTYERLGMSVDKKELIDSIESNSDSHSFLNVIKDPYILEFTGLETKVKYSENDLESALLNNLQDFLLELGNGFCFEARQKRISIENEHDRIDLVFYHRILKCHVLIDLKIREFSHADVGQMNFYLNYYKSEIRAENDNPPIGLILCANKNSTKVEYATAGLDNKLFVSKYKINLPSIGEIESFIHSELEEIILKGESNV